MASLELKIYATEKYEKAMRLIINSAKLYVESDETLKELKEKLDNNYPEEKREFMRGDLKEAEIINLLGASISFVEKAMDDWIPKDNFIDKRRNDVEKEKEKPKKKTKEKK